MEEARWLSLLIMLLVLGAIILCGYNAATYNRIANDDVKIESVSQSGARALLAFNVIILLILCPLFIWYFIKIAKDCPVLEDGKLVNKSKLGRFQEYVGNINYNGVRKSPLTPSRWNENMD